MLERATRLCATSPTMATRSPLNGNPRSRIVYRSSKAWVGCSCHPSPALITELFTPRASVSAAPAEVDQAVHGRPDRPTSEEDVVDEHNDFPGDIERNGRPAQNRLFFPE